MATATTNRYEGLSTENISGPEKASTATATASKDNFEWHEVPVAHSKAESELELEFFTVKNNGISYTCEITDKGKVKCYTDECQIFFGNCRKDKFTGDNSYWMCFGYAFQSSSLPKGFYLSKDGDTCYSPKPYFYKTLKAAAIGSLKYYCECSQEPEMEPVQKRTQNTTASSDYEEDFPKKFQAKPAPSVWVKTAAKIAAEKAQADLAAAEQELADFEAAEKAELEDQKALSVAAEASTKAQAIKDKLAARKAEKAAKSSTA